MLRRVLNTGYNDLRSAAGNSCSGSAGVLLITPRRVLLGPRIGLERSATVDYTPRLPQQFQPLSFLNHEKPRLANGSGCSDYHAVRRDVETFHRQCAVRLADFRSVTPVADAALRSQHYRLFTTTLKAPRGQMESGHNEASGMPEKAMNVETFAGDDLALPADMPTHVATTSFEDSLGLSALRQRQQRHGSSVACQRFAAPGFEPAELCKIGLKAGLSPLTVFEALQGYYGVAESSATQTLACGSEESDLSPRLEAVWALLIRASEAVVLQRTEQLLSFPESVCYQPHSFYNKQRSESVKRYAAFLGALDMAPDGEALCYARELGQFFDAERDAARRHRLRMMGDAAVSHGDDAGPSHFSPDAFMRLPGGDRGIHAAYNERHYAATRQAYKLLAKLGLGAVDAGSDDGSGAVDAHCSTALSRDSVVVRPRNASSPSLLRHALSLAAALGDARLAENLLARLVQVQNSLVLDILTRRGLCKAAVSAAGGNREGSAVEGDGSSESLVFPNGITTDDVLLAMRACARTRDFSRCKQYYDNRLRFCALRVNGNGDAAHSSMTYPPIRAQMLESDAQLLAMVSCLANCVDQRADEFLFVQAFLEDLLSRRSNWVSGEGSLTTGVGGSPASNGVDIGYKADNVPHVCAAVCAVYMALSRVQLAIPSTGGRGGAEEEGEEELDEAGTPTFTGSGEAVSGPNRPMGMQESTRMDLLASLHRMVLRNTSAEVTQLAVDMVTRGGGAVEPVAARRGRIMRHRGDTVAESPSRGRTHAPQQWRPGVQRGNVLSGLLTNGGSLMPNPTSTFVFAPITPIGGAGGEDLVDVDSPCGNGSGSLSTLLAAGLTVDGGVGTSALPPFGSCDVYSSLLTVTAAANDTAATLSLFNKLCDPMLTADIMGVGGATSDPHVTALYSILLTEGSAQHDFQRLQSFLAAKRPVVKFEVVVALAGKLFIESAQAWEEWEARHTQRQLASEHEDRVADGAPPLPTIEAPAQVVEHASHLSSLSYLLLDALPTPLLHPELESGNGSAKRTKLHGTPLTVGYKKTALWAYQERNPYPALAFLLKVLVLCRDLRVQNWIMASKASPDYAVESSAAVVDVDRLEVFLRKWLWELEAVFGVHTVSLPIVQALGLLRDALAALPVVPEPALTVVEDALETLSLGLLRIDAGPTHAVEFHIPHLELSRCICHGSGREGLGGHEVSVDSAEWRGRRPTALYTLEAFVDLERALRMTVPERRRALREIMSYCVSAAVGDATAGGELEAPMLAFTTTDFCNLAAIERSLPGGLMEKDDGNWLPIVSHRAAGSVGGSATSASQSVADVETDSPFFTCDVFNRLAGQVRVADARGSRLLESLRTNSTSSPLPVVLLPHAFSRSSSSKASSSEGNIHGDLICVLRSALVEGAEHSPRTLLEHHVLQQVDRVYGAGMGPLSGSTAVALRQRPADRTEGLRHPSAIRGIVFVTETEV